MYMPHYECEKDTPRCFNFLNLANLYMDNWCTREMSRPPINDKGNEGDTEQEPPVPEERCLTYAVDIRGIVVVVAQKNALINFSHEQLLYARDLFLAVFLTVV